MGTLKQEKMNWYQDIVSWISEVAEVEFDVDLQI